MGPTPVLQYDDAFFDALSRSILEVGSAETLPPACYTDAAFYEFEKEALFNHEWLCVGRVDWVKEPGTTSPRASSASRSWWRAIARTRSRRCRRCASIALCWWPKAGATRAASSARTITGSIR